MAFLDNSGDIILDAVLTDTGRMRLAKGDGTFKITKFALGDDEINYNNYNKNHASGSAYYDLTVLQTPILEAFTNNTSMMKSKLLSIPRTNLLYLPVILLNVSNERRRTNASYGKADGKYIITVDERSGRPTLNPNSNGLIPGLIPTSADTPSLDGHMNGFEPGKGEEVYIQVDQGLNTDEIHPKHRLSSDLIETQYIIEMDNRLGTIVNSGFVVPGAVGNPAAVSFIDDDNIASYFLSLGTDNGFVRDITGWTEPVTDTQAANSELKGPRGTRLIFKVAASTELQTSNFLFQRLGTTNFNAWTLPASDNATDSPTTSGATTGDATVHYIDSTIRITGATTGYRIDIPIRYVKRVDGG